MRLWRVQLPWVKYHKFRSGTIGPVCLLVTASHRCATDREFDPDTLHSFPLKLSDHYNGFESWSVMLEHYRTDPEVRIGNLRGELCSVCGYSGCNSCGVNIRSSGVEQ